LIPLNKQIAIRLKIARKSFGWKTATSFCNAVGIHKSTYSQHENGNRALTSEWFIKYGKLLEIEPGWLLTGHGYPCSRLSDTQSRKEFIENEIKQFQTKNILPFVELSPVKITDKYAIINMELFCKILIPAIEALNSKEILANVSDIIIFCLDLYSTIESLNIAVSEKEKFIHFNIDAVLKGSKNFSAKKFT